MNYLDQKLDELFRSYADAVAVPDAGAHFMPSLWEKIDARRSFTLRLKRMAQVFVGASAVLCLLFTGALALPRVQTTAHATYLDVLAEAHPTENLAAQGIVHSEPSEGNR